MRDDCFYILFCVVFIAAGFVGYTAYKRDQECDEVVFIEGELGMDARQVSSFSNGMSVIRLCDGTDLQVATHRIIKIVDK
jgi:hypothetical protein